MVEITGPNDDDDLSSAPSSFVGDDSFLDFRSETNDSVDSKDWNQPDLALQGTSGSMSSAGVVANDDGLANPPDVSDEAGRGGEPPDRGSMNASLREANDNEEPGPAPTPVTSDGDKMQEVSESGDRGLLAGDEAVPNGETAPDLGGQVDEKDGLGSHRVPGSSSGPGRRRKTDKATARTESVDPSLPKLRSQGSLPYSEDDMIIEQEPTSSHCGVEDADPMQFELTPKDEAISSGSGDNDQMGAAHNDAMVIDEEVVDGEVRSPESAKSVPLLDLELLCSLLERTQDAGDSLEEQDVLLFIGGTGSGKTTSVLYLAGAQFEEDETTGFVHYNPIQFPTERLREFKVDPGGRSITKTICVARTQLSDGREVVLADTPGFSDTDGAEYDIANGLGLIRSLQRAKTIRPVLVFNSQLFGDRFRSLSDTLDTVNQMMGGAEVEVDFSKFRYLFTRCEGREAQRIHRKLSLFVKSLMEQGGDSTKEQLLPLLEDMRRKTAPSALAFDPTDSKPRSKVLEELWGGAEETLALKSGDFFPFLSTGTGDKLRGELERRIAMLEADCNRGNLTSVQESVILLDRLSHLLPEAVDSTNRAISILELFVTRTHDNLRHRFQGLWGVDFKARDVFHKTLEEVKLHVSELMLIHDEVVPRLRNQASIGTITTDLFHELVACCRSVDKFLSLHDIEGVQTTLFKLNQVSVHLGTFPGGNTLTMKFLGELDRALAHVTQALQLAVDCLAADSIDEIVRIETPILFAAALARFLKQEDIASTEGSAVLEERLKDVLEALQLRFLRSTERINCISKQLVSASAEGDGVVRIDFVDLSNVGGSRTFLLALCRLKELPNIVSLTRADRGSVDELDDHIMVALSRTAKLATEIVNDFERAVTHSAGIDFEKHRCSILSYTKVVNGALAFCRELQAWPCFGERALDAWEHLNYVKLNLQSTLEQLDEHATQLAQGYKDALQAIDDISSRMPSAGHDISCLYVELIDHWEAWDSLLNASSGNNDKSWIDSAKSWFGWHGKKSNKANELDCKMDGIVNQVHHRLRDSIHRLLNFPDSKPGLLLLDCAPDICLLLAFLRTPMSVTLGSRILKVSRQLREMSSSALRRVTDLIQKMNELPNYMLSAHKYDKIDLFLRRLGASQDCLGTLNEHAARLVFQACLIREFTTQREFERFNRVLAEVPTCARVVRNVEEALTELNSKVEGVSLYDALHLSNEHDRAKIFHEIATVLKACFSVEAVAQHLKADAAESLYQKVLQRIETDLSSLHDDLLRTLERFPEDPGSFSDINSYCSCLSSFALCISEVKHSLATLATRSLNDCRSVLAESLDQLSSTKSEQDCEDFAQFLVLVKKSSRAIPYWKAEIDGCIDTLIRNRIARSETPESFLLDLSLALRGIGGEDSVVAEQLLWDHRKFQGVLTSIFSEATAGQDINYVLEGLDCLNAMQVEKLNRLYASFLTSYTDKILDGVTAFKTRDHSLRDFLADLVTEALNAVKEDSLDHSEQVVLLSSILFAHWSLTNLSDLVLVESGSSSLSKYVMKPHAAQVVACWIMLNVHHADDFHSLQHHLTQLGTGEGKSIVLGVVATMLALWGYSVDVVCYSSYLSNRDLKAFREMFAAFDVDRWIWYGTINGLSEKILGSDFRSRAEAAIRGDATPNYSQIAFRPNVLLVDEVDVFFGDDVFGSRCNPACCFEAEALVNLFQTIWARSASGGPTQGSVNYPNVEQCLLELPSAVHSQFKRYVRQMQQDALYVRNGSTRPYYVVEDRIAYKYFDGVTSSFSYGYQTHFLYIKEWENGCISKESMESVLSLDIVVATTSYAEYPFAYDVILGITGTLRSLRQDEIKVLEDMYGIRTYSYMPSVFGRNRLVFAGNDERGTYSIQCCPSTLHSITNLTVSSRATKTLSSAIGAAIISSSSNKSF